MSIILKQLLMKQAVKEGAKRSGIMTINKNIVRDVEKLYQKYVKDALAQGVDLDTLSPDQLKMIVAMNQPKPPKVFSGQEAMDQLNKLFPKKGEVVDMTGKKIDTSQGIMGGKSVTEILESGQVQKGTQGLKKSDKVKTREMFEEANNKFKNTQSELKKALDDLNNTGKSDIVADSVARITSMEPIAAMKEANSIIGRKGIYKNLTKEQSQKILKDTDDWINQRDPSDRWDYKRNKPYRDDPDFDPDDPSYDPDDGLDYATGGRAGYYTGGITDVKPDLSDIGHGSDSLMSRTRLVAPNSQATTSTGLNYLLAEDNDNIRVPFSGGGDPRRRAFLKLLATLTGGAAALKTGLLSLGGKGAGKQAAKEVVKQSVGSGQPPPYFFKLVEKIRLLGDDTLPTKDKTIAKKYKDYVMEEDFAGNIEIIKKGGDDMFPEDVYISYKVDDVSLPNKKGFTKAEQYEEVTARPDAEGKMKDVESGVPDEVVNEGSVYDDDYVKFSTKEIEKADGGRIGLSAGGGKFLLSKLGINSTSRRFLEKVFGKKGFEEIIKKDPDMHKGLLEVVEMFRNKDKEGLKMYMQKFLPHMDDATVEEFIVGTTPDIEGLSGQLTRLGSGRDYRDKIQLIKQAENASKLDKLDVTKLKPNAEGGLITMLGE